MTRAGEASPMEDAREGRIWNNTMHLSAALWQEMLERWGGVVAAVRIATDPQTGEVIVARAEPGSPHAEPVRLSPARHAAEFSFARALRKLNLKVPAGQLLLVKPDCRTVEGIGPVFVFPMARRSTLPRALPPLAPKE